MADPTPARGPSRLGRFHVLEVHVRTTRVALALAFAMLAFALPARAVAASASIVAVKSKSVTKAKAVDDVPRWRLYFGTKATLRGLVVRDDNQPAAGVTVTLLRQVPDAKAPGGSRITQVGKPLVTDAAGRWERKVKPDRITYYYVRIEAQPEAGIATPTASARLGLLVAPRLVQTSNPRQTGASFVVTGRLLMPGVRGLGHVVIERLTGRKASRVAGMRPKANGRFRLPLRHTKNGRYRYRLSFRPADPNRLIASSVIFTIRVTSIDPDDEEKRPAP
jgi:hypothetical protein